MQLGFVFVLICVFFFEDRLEKLAHDIMHIYIEEIASYLNFAATRCL